MSKKFPDNDPVSLEILVGTTQRMGTRLPTWALPVVTIVATWRAASELIARRRELVATGELARRIEDRRRAVLDAALVRAGVRERTRVLVLAGGPALPDRRTLAAVQVGAVRGGADVDDVGLLEGAMRRAASERMDVSATGVRRRAERRAREAARRGDQHLAAEVLVDAPEAPRRAASGPRPARQPRRDGGWTDWRFLESQVAIEESVERLPTWELPAVATGALLTFAPLVRPLADAAPWLAIAGLALVAAGWLGARRS
jgi:hypothetical protein